MADTKVDTEYNLIGTKLYNIIAKKNNPDIYIKFDGDLYDAFKKFPKKPVQEILMSLLKKDVISYGVGSRDYDDFGSMLLNKKELIGITLNIYTNDIDLENGRINNPFQTTIIIYYLYLKILTIVNYNDIVKDSELMTNCVKYLKYLFYKNLKLSGLTDTQETLVDGVIEFFFRKIILQNNSRTAIRDMTNQEATDYLNKNIDLIDRYSKFTEIFRSFTDLKILVSDNPNQLLRKFVEGIGVVGLSLLVTHGFNGFIASVIASQYSHNIFKGLYIDPKLQSYIEDRVIHYHQYQKFGEYQG